MGTTDGSVGGGVLEWVIEFGSYDDDIAYMVWSTTIPRCKVGKKEGMNSAVYGTVCSSYHTYF